MGPSILFDKSAIQSLGRQTVDEVARYFYTVVPPVLLMEILADLSLEPDDLGGARAKVTELARKVLPTDSFSNLHYHHLCIANLLGHQISMDRRPVVAGKRVAAKDGSKGIFIDVPPEEEAVLRWHAGQFNEDDLKFAIQWREKAKGANLEEMKQQIPKPPFKIRTLNQVAQFADFILKQPEFQGPLLTVFLNMLKCDRETYDRVCFRWRLAVVRSLHAFAPYAAHCLRVQLIFYIGMTHGILSTRSSNIVDLEYLHYSPFASVFCSGDKLHRQLAPLILGDDQTFVERGEMQDALNELVALRRDSADAEPGEDSLIHQLWLRYCKVPPRHAMRTANSGDQSQGTVEEGTSQQIIIQQMMEFANSIIEAVQEDDPDQENGPRFPV